MTDFAAYRYALNCIVDFSTKDATATIAKENSYLGLAGIVAAYQQEGFYSPKLKLIALPDFTMTRNVSRWNAGFSYGCVILTDPDLPPLIPLGFRPNCCGVTIVRINTPAMDFKDVTKKFGDVITACDEVDNDDFNRRNHFLSILRNGQDYYALLHGSFTFVKRDTINGPGLYLEQSSHWEKQTKVINHAGNQTEYLIGEEARDYHSAYLRYEKMTKELRVSVLNKVFGYTELLFNETHEGFFDINTMLLGAYGSVTPFEMPIMIAPDKPVAWVLSDKSINNLANDFNLPNVYFSPHGAGYEINDVKKARSSGISDKIYEIEFNNQAIMHCRNVQGLMVSYRKDVANYWCDGICACKKIFDLTPVYFAKI